MVKNMSQFKKWLEVGKEVKFIRNAIRPEKAGMTRKITKVQTNGLYTEIEGKNSWLALPKAKETIFEDGKIKFLMNFMTKNEEDYIERMKSYSNEHYIEALSRIDKRKQDLLSNGAEFINDYQYVWLEIEPVIT